MKTSSLFTLLTLFFNINVDATSLSPTMYPTSVPTMYPTIGPTMSPTVGPTMSPTIGPTMSPTVGPTMSPTIGPTMSPTIGPTTPFVSSKSSSNNELTSGETVGVVLGSICGVGVILGLMRRRKKRMSGVSNEKELRIFAL